MYFSDDQIIMQIRDVTRFLERIAPRSLQEGYDNSGLIVGNPNQQVKGIIVALDALESIVEEAHKRKCNLIVAHHPIVFKGLKQLTGSNYIERCIIKAIKYDIAIYAIHTNLDNALHQGVNERIASRIGLINCEVLAPKQNLEKLVVYAPLAFADAARKLIDKEALYDLGGSGHLHSSIGVDSNGGAARLECHIPSHQRSDLISKLHDLDVNIMYETLPISLGNPSVGAGLIGELEESMAESVFLKRLKTQLKTKCIRHTALRNRRVSRVAVCGGAGSFLLPKAKAAGADVFVTGDFKYHEFFDAENQLVIADVGHFESEQFTIDLLHEILKRKFRTFACYSTEVSTNPVKYL